MTRARLVSTQGEGLEAIVEVDGVRWCVMDAFAISEGEIPQPGEEFELEFGTLRRGPEDTWESVFSGNPDRKTGLEQIAGWSYRAFGRIVSIHPVVVDCGLLQVEDVVHTSDDRVIGEWVAFTIDRLDGWVKAK